MSEGFLWLLAYFCFILEIGPASVMVGNLVSGKRIAQASGRDLGQIEDNDQARKVSSTSLIWLTLSYLSLGYLGIHRLYYYYCIC